MIRNVILHVLNDQPLLADLYRTPDPSDSAVVCTNLRSTDGKAPSFISDAKAMFVFPMSQIHFIEVPASAVASGMTPNDEAEAGAPGGSATTRRSLPNGWAETTETGSNPAGGRGGEVGSAPEVSAWSSGHDDDSLDEDLLRRIREA